MVEVAGIEPASDDVEPGLLRAQSAAAFLGPHDHADKIVDGLSQLKVPVTSLTKVTSSGSLDDASYRVESYLGLTDFRARSGGEGEVGALSIGTYGFARSVHEITVRPRPASPGSTITVETDHPPVQLCALPPRPRPRTNQVEQAKPT